MIYSQAKTVLVWLGNIRNDKLLPKAFALLQYFHRQFQTELKEKNGVIAIEELTDEKHRLRKLPPLDTPEWETLSSFLTTPWFSRLWVLQEIALAKKVVAFVGSHEMHASSLEKLSNAVAWLGRKDYDKTFRLELNASYNLMYLIRAVSLVPKEGRGGIRLLRLLGESRSLICTHPEDKIYALFGMALENMNDGVRNALVASYSKSYSEVYRTAARSLIQKIGDIGVLNEVYDPLSRASALWPTWVPDWSTVSYKIPFTYEYGSHFKASANAIGNIQETCNDRIIRVCGFEVDNVGECLTCPPVKREFLAGFLKDIWRSTSARRHSSFDHYVNGETLGVAFTSTVAGGKDYYYRPISEGSEFMCEASTYWREVLSRDLLPEVRGKSLSVKQSSTDMENKKSLFERTVRRVYLDRSYFITDGGYIGVGSKDLKPRDKIIILYGGKTPYIIRREEECLEDRHPPGHDLDGQWCRLVGECYVHGMMYGEMMKREGRQEIFYNIW
jgi:hypothetical protein